MDGGFRMQVSNSDYVVSSMSAHPKFTVQTTVGNAVERSSMSDFRMTSTVNTGNGTSTLSGWATVDTTRVSTSIAGGATQYTWKTGSPITVNTVTDQITGGTMVLTSAAGNAQTQLSFGQACPTNSSMLTCVKVEKGTSNALTLQDTYTWDEFTKLQ